MTTFDYALRLAKEQKAAGYIADFYVNPASGSIIAISPDGGEYVFFSDSEE